MSARQLAPHAVDRVLLLAAGVAIGCLLRQGPEAATADSRSEPVAVRPGVGADPLVDGGDRLAAVTREAMPSVVSITSVGRNRGREVEETGSGVLMRHELLPGSIVVTNRHVVSKGRQSEDITIELADGRTVSPTRRWQDPASDLAVLHLPDVDTATSRWGDSDRLDIGHFVLALGSPFGLSSSVTLGIVSAKGRRALDLGHDAAVINQDFIQTDAAINPGNSGGPLIDLHGRVVGINTAIASESGGNEGIGFSIPSALARRVVDQLIREGEVKRAYLGVGLDPNFDADKAREFQLDRPRGAFVSQVYPTTPASAAGLRAGDIVLRFGPTEVLDQSHLIHLVSLTPVGKTVPLKVLRDGRNVRVDVTLTARKS
ncbi:MAG: trypsin-like peptidase domain-containing protein [Planctomycetota bacterium]